MASDIWLRTILIVRGETRCRHIGYSYRLAARVLLYAPSHRQDKTYHRLCYTSRGALAGARNGFPSVSYFKKYIIMIFNSNITVSKMCSVHLYSCLPIILERVDGINRAGSTYRKEWYLTHFIYGNMASHIF